MNLNKTKDEVLYDLAIAYAAKATTPINGDTEEEISEKLVHTFANTLFALQHLPGNALHVLENLGIDV